LDIIDAHQHFWTKKVAAQRERPPEVQKVLVRDYQPFDLKPLMVEAGVQQTVLVQNYSALENSYELLEYADIHDWIGAVVGWVDLADPAAGDVLDKLIEHPKFKGVRHQWENEPEPAWILSDDVLHGLRELAKRGPRYDLLSKPHNWMYIPQVAHVVPDPPLVIDHIAKPRIRDNQFDEWAVVMTQVAKFPQIMCKLSGMVTEPYVDKAIEVFGVDRVMFGSDWPVCLLAASYDEVLGALKECLIGLREDEISKILAENARSFYGIA
jgi:L-fuconolactonase